MFHFWQLSGIFLAQKQHTCLQKLFLTSKNSSKEYFVERKQIKSATDAYFKLRIFGGKTCHVCTQLEHVFFPHVYTLRCNWWYALPQLTERMCRDLQSGGKTRLHFPRHDLSPCLLKMTKDITTKTPQIASQGPQ